MEKQALSPKYITDLLRAIKVKTRSLPPSKLRQTLRITNATLMRNAAAIARIKNPMMTVEKIKQKINPDSWRYTIDNNWRYGSTMTKNKMLPPYDYQFITNKTHVDEMRKLLNRNVDYGHNVTYKNLLDNSGTVQQDKVNALAKEVIELNKEQEKFFKKFIY